MVHHLRPIPNLTGKVIDNGRLKLLEVLGAGAFGTVYRAIDVLAIKPLFFAVKCLHKPEPDSEQSYSQTREFILQKLVCDHPNVLTIHKTLFDDSYLYVVVDFCPGGDMFRAITESFVYQNNVELVRRTFIEILDAVHHCHENKVFHRDIKPENILCSEDGSNILLADFGLATSDRVSRQFGCGSSFYMSPECIGREIKFGVYSTRYSDIWSLGVILTNMIAGRNPWRQATTKDEAFSSYLHDPEYLRKVLPISTAAHQILKRIFVLNPLCRITIPALREELLKLDTFFMSEQELKEASPVVRSVAEAYAGRVPTVDMAAPRSHQNCTILSDSDGSLSAIDPDEMYLYASPDENAAIDLGNPTRSIVSIDIVARSANRDDFSIGSSSSSLSSSDDESDGPITPETLPIDSIVEVPDMPEGQDLGVPVIVTPMVPAQKAPPSRAKLVFWNTVQRLKGDARVRT